jgi:hypothetical protein
VVFNNNFRCTAYAAHQINYSNTEYINQIDSPEKLQTDLLLSIFSPYVATAIENYYGEPRQFDLWNAKILNIKRLKKGSFNFEIIISVKTFKGAHNPPYGLETTTIRVDDLGIHVIDFNHQGLK